LDADAHDLSHLFDCADAPAIGNRHKAFTGNVGDDLESRPLCLSGRSNVDQDELINFLVVEDLDRIAGVADVFRIVEPDGLDQPFSTEKQGTDHARLEHYMRSAKFLSSHIPNRWLFSG